jgi:uncharacterized HAD superfamily protein
LWEVKENQKICAFDLDDTLADSTPFWIRFVNSNINTQFANLNEMKNTLPYNKYRELKLKYRTSDIKINIPVIDDAARITSHLKAYGYEIIIITARPFEEHKCLFKLTTDWLNKNHICYDGIIWGENKDIKVMTEVENLKFIVEDHRYIANKCAKFGMRVYLLNNKYNQGETHSNVIRIYSLLEIQEYEENE